MTFTNVPTFIPASTTPVLRGRTLTLARIFWLVLTFITVILVLLGLYFLYGEDTTPCDINDIHSSCVLTAQGLGELGISMELYEGLIYGLTTCSIFTFVAVGALIFWKKSQDWSAYILSLLMVVVGAGVTNDSLFVVIDRYPQFSIPLKLLIVALYSGAGFIPCLFPDGRFVPKWGIGLMVLWVARNIGFVLFEDPTLDALGLALMPFFIVIMIYRYRKIANVGQRQQIKWIVVGFTIGAIAAIFDLSIGYFYDPVSLGDGKALILFELFRTGIYSLSISMFALSFGISIVRYRLWDIDVIVNRSLVYGSLTVFLALVFSLILYSISLLQNQSSPITFMVAAVCAVLLFRPARNYLQRFVDRYFYQIRINYQNFPPKLQPDQPQLDVGINIRQTPLSAYNDLQLIGKGGMGTVYRAIHPNLNIPVAIKLLGEFKSEGADYLARFRREAEILELLQHPNIVRFYDFYEKNGTCYILMEYIVGDDLATYLRNNGKLLLAEARPIIKQIANALDYIHEKGLVHRDIKPSNILLDDPTGNCSVSERRVVLTDFGITKTIGAQTSMSIKGGAIGTFAYMSPEQIQALDIDVRADVYSFAVMVYEMVTGRQPFHYAHTATALLIAHLHHPVPDPRQFVPELSQSTAQAIVKALSKQSEQRFSTVGEFVAAL